MPRKVELNLFNMLMEIFYDIVNVPVAGFYREPTGHALSGEQLVPV